MLLVASAIAALMFAYMVRHYLFSLYRLRTVQDDTFEAVELGEWPRLVVFIAAHNEEQVIEDCLRSLAATDYPRDRLRIVPVNDRSKDKTGEICDRVAREYPDLIHPFHRTAGAAGKPAAMKEASEIYLKDADVFIIFDADYQPGPHLLKQLVAPMLDPSIGVTMGRVVPINAGQNLLTRLLDLERSSGYQVDQQARQGLGLIAQYGGTVGAIRVRAFWEIGGFDPSTLAEDTDLTYRMLLRQWRVRYLNTAECYEEVPETWGVRFKQVKRWAKGHNQVLFRYFGPVLFSKELTFPEKLDALALLLIYTLAPLSLLSWVLFTICAAINPVSAMSLSAIPAALLVCAGFGNFAPFFQTAAAVRLDRSRQRLRILSLAFVGYFVNSTAVTAGLVSIILDRVFHRSLVWDKTTRFRSLHT